MATAVLASIPAIVLLVVAQKYVAAGDHRRSRQVIHVRHDTITRKGSS